MLGLFRVDTEGRVRNLYGIGFLDVRILVADLETTVLSG